MFFSYAVPKSTVSKEKHANAMPISWWHHQISPSYILCFSGSGWNPHLSWLSNTVLLLCVHTPVSSLSAISSFVVFRPSRFIFKCHFYPSSQHEEWLHLR
jgi:hypothetical protein